MFSTPSSPTKNKQNFVSLHKYRGIKYNIPQTYLCIMSTYRTRTSEWTIRVTFMFIWVAKVSYFIIPCLHMKCWGPVPFSKKITTKIK